MSLRTLINFRIIFSVLFILLLGGITTIWQARQSVAEEVHSSINFALQMVEFSFSQTPLSGRYGSNWLPQIEVLQQTRHIKVAISEAGREPVELVTKHMDNGGKRAPKWFIDIVSSDYVTEKYNVSMADGTINTIFITADPMDEISEAWGESRAFLASVVAMLLVIFFAVNLVFNSVLKTVSTILSGLQKVEKGHYGLVLPDFRIKEFDAIATEINGMSAALKLAQENNQALARHTMQIQESERQTLSRELHDEMGQSLTAIKAMAVASKQDNVDIKQVADSIIDVCNHLAGVVRSMMRTLHPLSLAELGLQATLSGLVREWRRRSPQLHIDLDYDEQLENMDGEVMIHVYRIVQECLTNVIRHARATEVSILLEKRGNNVWVVVSDNGVGGMAGQGFGVLGMRERAESLGGKFLFESGEDGGVSVVVQLPYTAKSGEINE